MKTIIILVLEAQLRYASPLITMGEHCPPDELMRILEPELYSLSLMLSSSEVCSRPFEVLWSLLISIDIFCDRISLETLTVALALELCLKTRVVSHCFLLGRWNSNYWCHFFACCRRSSCCFSCHLRAGDTRGWWWADLLSMIKFWLIKPCFWDASLGLSSFWAEKAWTGTHLKLLILLMRL